MAIYIGEDVDDALEPSGLVPRVQGRVRDRRRRTEPICTSLVYHTQTVTVPASRNPERGAEREWGESRA